MLNKRNLQVAQFASKEASRYTLQAIQVTPDATIGCDGHRLVRVSNPTDKPENFPVIDGFAGETEHGSFLLEADAAKAIEKALPKKTTIPILSNAAVNTVTDDAGVHPTIAVTDLSNPQLFRPHVPSGQFPNWEAIMPKAKPKFMIAVNAEYLAQIAKFAAQFAGETHKVEIRFWDEQSPMRFDATDKDSGQGMTAICMPMRSDFVAMPGTYGYKAPEEKPEPVAAD